jgi:hypothetical protein
MILYLKGLTYFTRKLVDHNKVAGYKTIYTTLYTNNEYAEKEIRKTILFTAA